MPNAAEDLELLESLRSRIDELDKKICLLLLERIQVSKEVGEIKRKGDGIYHDAARETEVMEKVSSSVGDPKIRKGLIGVFNEIISVCRCIQAGTKIYYLGPEGSFCHRAVRYSLGSAITAFPCSDIEEVFEKTSLDQGSLGIVPIENSIEGPIGQSYDKLAEFDLLIQREVFLPIQLSLLGNTQETRKAKRLYSHPTALAQARPWIKKHLPYVEPVGVFSTSHAALLALEDGEALAVSSKEAGTMYGLKVIMEEIPLGERSWTRFVILGSQVPKSTGKDKTSIYFTLPHKPGTLKRALESFSDTINLCLIFSRPIKGRQWEYGFFLDLEGHISDPTLTKALDSLQRQTVTFKLLGSYPRGWPCL